MYATNTCVPLISYAHLETLSSADESVYIEHKFQILHILFPAFQEI